MIRISCGEHIKLSDGMGYIAFENLVRCVR